jgi:quinol monooxygenase YgiN
LYAVAEKEHPARIRVFEVYAHAAAYKAHLETLHFKKYKTTTQAMVKSLKRFGLRHHSSAASFSPPQAGSILYSTKDLSFFWTCR